MPASLLLACISRIYCLLVRWRLHRQSVFFYLYHLNIWFRLLSFRSRLSYETSPSLLMDASLSRWLYRLGFWSNHKMWGTAAYFCSLLRHKLALFEHLTLLRLLYHLSGALNLLRGFRLLLLIYCGVLCASSDSRRVLCSAASTW